MHLLKTEFGESLNADSITRLFILEARDRALEGVTVEKLVDSTGSAVIAELLSGAQIEIALFRVATVTDEAGKGATAHARALLDALSQALVSSSRGLVEVSYFKARVLSPAATRRKQSSAPVTGTGLVVDSTRRQRRGRSDPG